MADHHGSAELIAGALLRRPLAFTEWWGPGTVTSDVVRADMKPPSVSGRARVSLDPT